MLLLRSGFAAEWAAISAEHIRFGETDIIVRQVAGLVRTGRAPLAAEAAAALTHVASANMVRFCFLGNPTRLNFVLLEVLLAVLPH